MTAIEYLEHKNRMTKGCSIGCCNCPLDSSNNKRCCSCIEFEYRYSEEAVVIIKDYAQSNPIKTYLSVLLESFPLGRFNESQMPNFCPQDIFGAKAIPRTIKYNACSIDGNLCKECWNRRIL